MTPLFKPSISYLNSIYKRHSEEMPASTLNRLLSALQQSSMCKGPTLTSALLSTVTWHVGTKQVEDIASHSTQPYQHHPTQSEEPALGVRKTSLTTETSFLEHTPHVTLTFFAFLVLRHIQKKKILPGNKWKSRYCHIKTS